MYREVSIKSLLYILMFMLNSILLEEICKSAMERAIRTRLKQD